MKNKVKTGFMKERKNTITNIEDLAKARDEWLNETFIAAPAAKCPTCLGEYPAGWFDQHICLPRDAEGRPLRDGASS